MRCSLTTFKVPSSGIIHYDSKNISDAYLRGSFVYFPSVAVNPPVCVPCKKIVRVRKNVRQVVRNNDLDRMHLLEAADEWPFLREVVGNGGGSEAEEEEVEEGKQEHLLCDAIVGEPFYYRVSDAVPSCLPSRYE